jgi:hypothetical protein
VQLLIEKLPLPDPGPIGLAGHLAYIEKVRHLLEAEYLSTLTRAQKGAARLFGEVTYPDWCTSEWVPWEDYVLLQTAANRSQYNAAALHTRPTRPTPSPRAEVTLEELRRPSGDAFADWVWNATDEDLPSLKSTAPVKPKLDAKEELRRHYLALLLPELEKRAPVWWKVLSVLHEKSPADLSFFELSTWRLAKDAGVAKESVRNAVSYLLDHKLVESSTDSGTKTPTRLFDRDTDFSDLERANDKPVSVFHLFNGPTVSSFEKPNWERANRWSKRRRYF